jgi:hypothetical protein
MTFIPILMLKVDLNAGAYDLLHSVINTFLPETVVGSAVKVDHIQSPHESLLTWAWPGKDLAVFSFRHQPLLLNS